MRTQDDDAFDAEFASARDDTDRGFETRRNKALIAAALFDEPVTPIKIDRFTIVRELGAGGMGVVYVAYDEQLDRRVAVKLLRGGEPSSDAQRRLEREAQAMARLQHPHVVAVYQVGKFEDQVFVAMEFVDGQDLRGWLEAKPRDWRAIVEVFVQAGEGLAAAHAAGIVHRDFKPDNVLVGKDARVRVADFGLAHAFDADHEPLDSELNTADASASHSSQLGIAMTRTGAVMGTPAYMPPEQYAGKRTDARSDQFSFCVALWEGLHGCRPFSGRNLAALSLSISEGRIDPPPETSEVPQWLTDVLARGMSPNADARWPTMRHLLDAIQRDPIARRRRLLLRFGLGGAGLALVAGLTWVTASELRHSARARYWTGLTEQLLEIERERGLQQANDDALRARDATRMSVYRRFGPQGPGRDHEDPTVAAALLREVEGAARTSSEWISAANETLGASISHAVLSGHRDAAASLVFSADGAWLFSASLDGEVRRWRVATGEGELLHTHTKKVTKLALSPDGTLLASSSLDGTVRVTNLQDPTRSHTLVRDEPVIPFVPDRPAEPLGTLAILDIAFSPDGRLLALGTKDDGVLVCEVSSGVLTQLRGHQGAVYGVSFDAEGRRLLTTSHDQTAKLWRLDSSSLIATLGGHTAGVFHGRILDERRILTASDDGSLRLHELGAGEPSSRVLVQHAQAITALDVHGQQAVTAATDGSMIVSALDGSHAPIELPAHDDGTWDVVFTPDGQYVASASFDATARITRADGRGVPRSLLGHRHSLTRLAVDRSGRWLATGSYDTTVRIWDLERPPLEIPLRGHTSTVFSLDSDAARERIVSASHDGTVRIWDARDGTTLAVSPGGGSGYVNHARMSSRQDVVAIARGSDVAELWQLDSGELRPLRGHTRAVWHVAFDADGERLATASFDETARTWDVDSGEPLLVLEGHVDKVTGVDFSPDGTQLVTASHDGTVRIWDAGSGDALALLRGHAGKISSLVRSPDGHTLATASDDGTVRLWSGPLGQQGQQVRVLAGHDKPVWSVAFDHAGARLVTGSWDSQVKVWDVASGSLLRSFSGHADAVWDAAFTDDGRVITVSNDGTVRLWSLDEHVAPIVLSSRGAGLTSVVVLANQRAAAAANDGSITLWSIGVLSADTGLLHDRLRHATIHCLAIDERVRELGEDPREAELVWRACVERRQAGDNQ